MINVGIIGGETEAAGELIRILINHPDVILRAVCSTEHTGQRIDSYHPGLIGDTDLCFTSSLEGTKLNCVFLCGEPWQAQEYMRTVEGVAHCRQSEDCEPDEELHIVDMTGAYRNGHEGMVYGFPEYRRKALVRGSLRASVPSSVALAIELALFPLAKNNLLHGSRIPVRIEMAASHDRQDTTGRTRRHGVYADAEQQSQLSTRLDPVAPAESRPDADRAAEEAAGELREIDSSFNSTLSVSLSRNPEFTRGMKVTATVPCSAGVEEVRRLYNEAYSDHSFTFVVDGEVSMREVSNTNKCLIRIEGTSSDLSEPMSRPGVKITLVLDNIVKGGAGNAVHCMNLLFGLSERTGLALKAAL